MKNIAYPTMNITRPTNPSIGPNPFVTELKIAAKTNTPKAMSSTRPDVKVHGRPFKNR